MELHEKLAVIQSELKVPKGQMNTFGNYKYRSAEDIMEAIKPHLSKHKLLLTINEETRELAGVIFSHSVARVSDGINFIESSSQAGIDINRKGMDVAQSFGASSSYAKKYALGNLFLLDDTKDPDATNAHGKTSSPVDKKKMSKDIMDAMMNAISEGQKEVVSRKMKNYNMTKAQKTNLEQALNK